MIASAYGSPSDPAPPGARDDTGAQAPDDAVPSSQQASAQLYLQGEVVP